MKASDKQRQGQNWLVSSATKLASYETEQQVHEDSRKRGHPIAKSTIVYLMLANLTLSALSSVLSSSL